MIKTIKDNYYMVIKILLNQIGMDFFGLVLYIASTAAGQGEGKDSTGYIMKIVTSVFSVIFYLVLLYTMTRDEGLKDEIRIEAGRMHPQPLKFFWLSLCANSINILLGVIITIVNILTAALGDAIPYIFGEIGAVCITIVTLTEGMYTGLLSTVLTTSGIACIAITIPSILVCTFGYIVGTKGGIAKMIAKKAEAANNSDSTK